MKISSLSIEQLLYYVDIAVKAALSVNDIKSRLSEFSVTEEKMQAGLTLAAEVKVWEDRQQKIKIQVRQTQRSLDDARRSIKALYSAHRHAARFVYRQDADQQELLRLKGPIADKHATWRSQVNAFYANADTKTLAKFGVPAAEITEVKELIGKLADLEILRNDARRQAQQATEGKQAVVQELRAWFSRFMRTARLACSDQPQLLESMGVVVPS